MGVMVLGNCQGERVTIMWLRKAPVGTNFDTYVTLSTLVAALCSDER